MHIIRRPAFAFIEFVLASLLIGALTLFVLAKYHDSQANSHNTEAKNAITTMAKTVDVYSSIYKKILIEQGAQIPSGSYSSPHNTFLLKNGGSATVPTGSGSTIIAYDRPIGNFVWYQPFGNQSPEDNNFLNLFSGGLGAESYPAAATYPPRGSFNYVYEYRSSHLNLPLGKDSSDAVVANTHYETDFPGERYVLVTNLDNTQGNNADGYFWISNNLVGSSPYASDIP